MKNPTHTALILTAAFGLAATLSACDYDHRDARQACSYSRGENCDYNKTSKYTGRDGTVYEEKDRSHVEYDANGNERVVIDSERTQDPKGLFNKKTTHKKKVVIDKDNVQ